MRMLWQEKVQNENNEEFNSFNSHIPYLTHYEMEKQFQSAYTIANLQSFNKS